jgi:hypothetical protein
VKRPTLSRYLELRLGKDPSTQLRNFLAAPFGASSFDRFWRSWNPVYGYVLLYFTYRPLRRVMPRPIATLLTFMACGLFLHDAIGWIVGLRVRFPVFTLLFTIFGVASLVARGVRQDLSNRSFPARVAVNVASLAACFTVWWGILRLLVDRSG